MSDVKVSVIIPTYNRRDFVLEAIDSVLRQNLEGFELIVVDDGSIDGTGGAVGKLEDPRLHYIRQPNRGVAAARNVGVARSMATLIAFLDSDDLWLPDKLRMQVGFMDANPGISICQTEEVWVRGGRRVNPRARHKKRSGWIFRECLPLCIVSPSAAMMRRVAFDALGGFDESLPACEDYDLWLRASLRYEIITLGDPLIVKRGGHAGQLSAQWGLDIYRVEALRKILRDPELPDESRALVEAEIVRRSRIVAEGARKRGKPELAARFSGE